MRPRRSSRSRPGLIEEGLYPATEPVTTIRYEVPAGIVAANAATVQLEDGVMGSARRALHQRAVVPRRAVARRSRPDGVQLHGQAPRSTARWASTSRSAAPTTASSTRPTSACASCPSRPRRCAAPARQSPTSCAATTRPQHPTDPALGFVYGTIIVDLDPRTSPDGRARDAHIRNVDDLRRRRGRPLAVRLGHERAARPAARARPDARRPGDRQRRHHRRALPGPHRGRNRPRPVRRRLRTSIAGTAYVTGYSTFVVDSRDPLGDGFLLG